MNNAGGIKIRVTDYLIFTKKNWSLKAKSRCISGHVITTSHRSQDKQCWYFVHLHTKLVLRNTKGLRGKTVHHVFKLCITNHKWSKTRQLIRVSHSPHIRPKGHQDNKKKAALFLLHQTITAISNLACVTYLPRLEKNSPTPSTAKSSKDSPLAMPYIHCQSCFQLRAASMGLVPAAALFPTDSLIFIPLIFTKSFLFKIMLAMSATQQAPLTPQIALPF